MSDWRQVKLGDVARVQSGYAFKSQDWVDSGVPVVKIQNVRSGRVTLDGCSYVTDEVASTAARFSLQCGDVLVTMSGEIGSIGVVRHEGKLLLNQRVGRVEITAHEAVSLGFLGYVLQHPRLKEQMVAVAYGAAQPNISPALLASLPIFLPDRPAQDRVVAILLSLDELIENNTRRIQILEEMAQAIYREWFVNFRYPGHEDVPLVESELGPIPEGWHVESIGSLALLVSRGVSPKYVDDSSSTVLNQKCIRDGRVSFGPSRPHNTSVPEQRVLRFGDVLVNSTGVGTLGRVAQLYRSCEATTVDSHVTIVRPNPAVVDIDYFGVAMLGRQDEFEAMGVGSTGQTELSRGRIGESLMLRPDHGSMEQFGHAVGPMRTLAVTLGDQTEILRSTRDLLLPRLISGEVDVSELDIDVGELVT